MTSSNGSYTISQGQMIIENLPGNDILFAFSLVKRDRGQCSILNSASPYLKEYGMTKSGYRLLALPIASLGWDILQ